MKALLVQSEVEGFYDIELISETAAERQALIDAWHGATLKSVCAEEWRELGVQRRAEDA